MAHSLATQHGSEPNPLDTSGLCLLSLDGGGVRGLSTLYILKGLMDRLNHARKINNLTALKPCEVFDLIGGTSTGGLIAIMLGRLEMEVDECISAYSNLIKAVFAAKSSTFPISWRGKVKAQFDSERLRNAIEEVVTSKGASVTDAFNDGKDRGCRTFVCCAAKETTSTTRLRSYTLPNEGNIPATICEAALATSAATGFFDPVSIGARQFVDGALGANNPVEEVEGEAANIWCAETGELKPLVKCFVTIGTGNPGKKAIEDDMIKFLSKTLVGIATETEETERKFIARWAHHYDTKRYFRFNVDQGLQDVGLAEYKEQGKLEAATDEYLKHQAQKFQVRDCVENLQQKQNVTEISIALSINEYQTRRILQKQRITERIDFIPFSKNRHFVGRTEELEVLKQKLMVDTDCQKMSIVGLGGTGKSQLALQFAYLVKENWPEFSIFWIPALSMESFEQACTDIANVLHIPQATDKKEDMKELVKQWLSRGRVGRWLLVVDNADNLDILFGLGNAKGIIDFLPESEEGVTVYTTRIQEVADSLTRGDIMDLGPMSHLDAAEFLKKSVNKKEYLRASTTVTELLEALTYLPLAIAQASAYLNMNKMTVATYLRLLHNTEQDLVSLMSKEFRDGTRYKSSANAIATTWVVSFKQVCERDTAAADLLAFMSCVEWKAIPRSLLPSVQPEARMEEAIGMLCGYAFLARRDDSNQGGDKDEGLYDMHRLVHLATRIWIAQHGNKTEVDSKAFQQVVKVFPSNDYENQALWRVYLPHALRLLRNAKDSTPKDKSELCLLVGRCLIPDRRYYEAVELLTKCCRLRSKLEEHDADRLASQHELAKAYQEDYQTQKSILLIEHVVAMREKLLEEEHVDRLASQQVLAMAYEQDGQVQKAIKLMEHVTAITEKSLAKEHSDRLESQYNLAVVYEADGQLQKAIRLMEHIVTIHKELLVEEHPDRLASQHQLARVYNKDGQTQKAITLLEHVLVASERGLGEDHPSRLIIQQELATAYRAAGQTQKAIELLEQVVAIREKMLVEEHQNRLGAQHDLAVTYQEDGQAQKAVKLLEYVVAIRKKVLLVEEHPLLLRSQHELARAYQADGQLLPAIKLMEHVVTTQEKVLTEENPSRLTAQQILATAYRAEGQTQKATKLLEHVVAIREKVLTEENQSRLGAQHDLAVTYQADGQAQKAIALLEHVVAVRKRVLLVEDHFLLLTSQHELARAYQADGQLQKAIKLMEHVVTVEERVFTEEHLLLLASQHELARAYRADGELQKAIRLMEHVVAVQERIMTKEHPSRLASQYNLALAYQADGKLQKAVTLLEHAVAVEARHLREGDPSRLASVEALEDARTQLSTSTRRA